MNEQENLRAHSEAMNQPASRALRSARRAQLWEGLNRYLASEASHAHKVAEQEHGDDASESGAGTTRTGRGGTGTEPDEGA